MSSFQPPEMYERDHIARVPRGALLSPCDGLYVYAGQRIAFLRQKAIRTGLKQVGGEHRVRVSTQASRKLVLG